MEVPEGGEEIVIHVGSMTGRSFMIDASPKDTVLDVKNKIYRQANLPPETQILVYRNKELHNDYCTLSGYNVGDGAKLQLVLQMAGGQSPVRSRPALEGEDDIKVLENLLCELDLDTAIRILNLIEENPEILEEVFDNGSTKSGSDTLGSTSISSSGLSSFSQSQASIDKPSMSDFSEPETVDEMIASPQGSVLSKKSSIASIKERLTQVIERLETPPNGARPCSTKSITLSIHARNSSINSIELMTLLKKRPSMSGFVSRASSGKVKPTRPSTSNLVIIDSILTDDLVVTISKSRPATTKIRPDPATKIPRLKASQRSSTVSLSVPKQTPVQPKSIDQSKNSNIKSRSKLIPSKQGSRTSLSKDPPVAPPKKPVQQTPGKCATCSKKLGLTNAFKCKCDKVFCSFHRYSDRHKCSYDFKAIGRAKLAKEMPLVRGDRVSKI